MTGILPIKKYGSHSALNMFTEYSMTNPREMTEFLGLQKGKFMNYAGSISETLKEPKFGMMAIDLPKAKTVCHK